LTGSHSFFEADLLPPERTIELREVDSRNNKIDPLEDERPSGEADFHQSWTRKPDLSDLPVIDLFRDGSVYIVHAPGHLPGHINLLVRAETGSSSPKWVYLAGDACHDRRIMRRQKEIGEWRDGQGHLCCIHADRKTAEQTIDRIRELEERGIEVIFAHDVEWEEDARNKHRFYGMDSNGY
jgi:glyoxylase-like metal-dependent hydrolase (beta-lactamase superfamily II)